MAVKSKTEFIRKLRETLEEHPFISGVIFFDFCMSCIHVEECSGIDYHSDCSLSYYSILKLNKKIFPLIEELIKKSEFKPRK